MTVENQQIAQVVLTAIEKDGRTEELNTSSFTTQFDLDKPELEPSMPIRIEGNKTEIEAALERLSEQTVASESNDERQEDEQEKADEGAASGQAGSNRRENQDAAAYENPSALQVTEEGVPIVRITTEGCDVRVDVGQGYAIQQSRVETTENGSIDPGTCEDSEKQYPLQKSYLACGDVTDLETRRATAHYMQFYTDSGGNRQEVGECQPDDELIFDIVENREDCSVYLDYSNNEAVTQSTLVYTNAKNAVVQVRGCEASEEVEAVPLIETTDGCSIRHDFGADVSYQQSRDVYTLGGVTWQAGFCADSETEYPHEDLYLTEAGENVCAPIADLGAGTVTRQYRTGISVASLRQYITECKPDAQSLQLVSDAAACSNPATWTHDVSAGVSYGQERFYYTAGGVREYVNECQDSDTVYTHQVETTGWQLHDDQLFAYALSTVYITPSSGRYNILTSTVLDGTPQTPFTYEGASSVANGEVTYESCSRYEGRNFIDSYKRPDNTTHTVVVGPADPIGPINACTLVIDWTWPLTNTAKSLGSCSSSNPQHNTVARKIGTYAGTHVITREDGVTIADETATRSLTCGATDCLDAGAANIRYNDSVPACPASQSGSTVQDWVGEEGWQ